MRWTIFVALQVLVIAVIVGVAYTHQDRVTVLKTPPASIAQWYKPQNKRQVWLHTMFKLRREMLAVEMYAKAQDAQNLQKWSVKLGEDYLKIAEMVPEWRKKLNLTAVSDLQSSVTENRFGAVADAVADLNESCKSCHTDFRAVTAALYRAPDFSRLKVEASTPFNEHMRTMSTQVNQVMIAFIDGRDDGALAAFAALANAMDRLGPVCANCHKDRSKTYPSEKITQAMADLEQSLKTGALQDKGKALGTLAVMACAECHGTHRLSYDARQVLSKKNDWRALLKHSF